jgi:hypothetical protein
MDREGGPVTRFRNLIGGVIPLLASAGCSSALDAPSAYETAQYLCGEAQSAAWSAELDSCRAIRAAGGLCAGVLSFRGIVDEQPVVASIHARTASFVEIFEPNGNSIRSLRARATAPYFDFSLTIDFFADKKPGRPPDSNSNLNFEARGGNYLVGVIPNDVSIQVDTDEEFAFSTQAALSRGGTFEGCFHVFLR